MDLAVLFSGGKDSAYAMHRAMETDIVRCLVSIESENPESYMFHTPNIDITSLQAKAIGLPLIVGKTKGKKEEEIEDMKAALKRATEEYDIEGVVTGAIESVYQAERVQRACHELGLWCFNPLWKMDQEELVRQVIAEGFETMVSGVFAYPMEEEWLGRRLDVQALNELLELSKKFGISPSGEGGEIETTVLFGPMFKKRIDVLDTRIEFKANAGVCHILDARLLDI